MKKGTLVYLKLPNNVFVVVAVCLWYINMNNIVLLFVFRVKIKGGWYKEKSDAILLFKLIAFKLLKDV